MWQEIMNIDWVEMAELQSVALGETTVMIVIAGVLACALGLPLGIFLTVTSRGHLTPLPRINQVVGMIVNAMRSVPFIILMVALRDMQTREWKCDNYLQYLKLVSVLLTILNSTYTPNCSVALFYKQEILSFSYYNHPFCFELRQETDTILYILY